MRAAACLRVGRGFGVGNFPTPNKFVPRRADYLVIDVEAVGKLTWTVPVRELGNVGGGRNR